MSPLDEAEALERAEHGASEVSSGPGMERESIAALAYPNAPAIAGPKPAFSRRKKPTLTIILVPPDPPEAA